jgi:predicted enzyme involved in methoxymalonyl-ACP biosynthesis
MEEFIINSVISAASEKGYKKVIGEYLPTKKNGMVADIYPRMGFTPEGDGKYSADVGTFEPRKTFITVSE